VVTAGAGVRLVLDGRPVIDALDNAAEGRWEVPFTGAAGRPLPLELFFRHQPGARPGIRLGLRRSDGSDGLRLAAPQRRVVLPAGTGWTDFWSGTHHQGGQVITVPAPLDTVPLFMPDGAVLPMGPHCLRADDTVHGPLEVRVCPGRDGACFWYEDAGDGFGHVRGERSLVALTWDESRRELRLGARQGSWPGMPAQRTVQVVLVRPGHGTGEEPGLAPDAKSVYDGQPLTISIPKRQ